MKLDDESLCKRAIKCANINAEDLTGILQDVRDAARAESAGEVERLRARVAELEQKLDLAHDDAVAEALADAAQLRRSNETLEEELRRKSERLAELDAPVDSRVRNACGEYVPVSNDGVYWKSRYDSCEERHLSRFHDLEDEYHDLRVLLAALEAPPVVPEGWEIGCTMGAWVFWETNVDVPGQNRRVARAQTARALAWAIEHDARPPHAADAKGGELPPGYWAGAQAALNAAPEIEDSEPSEEPEPLL